MRELEQGEKYPYHGKLPKDWAERAALGVLYDLCDRRGIKHELREVDGDARKDIVESLSRIIRAALPEGREQEDPAKALAAKLTEADAEKWRIAMALPLEENEIFFGGDFNVATLTNAVHAVLRRREPQQQRQEEK